MTWWKIINQVSIPPTPSSLKRRFGPCWSSGATVATRPSRKSCAAGCGSTRAALLTGGDSGPAIQPGDIEQSELIAAIRYAPDSYQMPPDGKLSAEVIADFEQWIALGAPDPRVDEVPSSATPATSFAEVLAKRRKHWAYQPLEVIAPPEVLPALVAKSDRPVHLFKAASRGPRTGAKRKQAHALAASLLGPHRFAAAACSSRKVFGG